MKVVYRSILEEIEDAKIKATEQGRTIARIELDCFEWAELRLALLPLNNLFPGQLPGWINTVHGIPVVKV